MTGYQDNGCQATSTFMIQSNLESIIDISDKNDILIIKFDCAIFTQAELIQEAGSHLAKAFVPYIVIVVVTKPCS